MKRKCLLIIFLFSLQTAYAINPFIKNYTIAEGLPTNKIMYTYQDKDGFIWFASDAGVIRFDGTNFKRFSTEEGMSDNFVIRIKQDLSGRLWFMNMNGTLNYYLDNTIYNEKNDTTLNQLRTNFYFYDFYEDTDSTLYFYNQVSDVYILKKNNSEVARFNFSLDNKTNLGLFHLNKSLDDKFLLWSATGIFELETFEDSAYLNPFENYSINRVFNIGENKTIAFQSNGYANIYRGRDILYQHILQLGTQYVNSLTVDSDGLIWIATFDRGVFCFDENKIIYHFNVEQTQGILIDEENNIWVTSESKGIFKISREILKYQYWETENFEELGIKSIEPTNDGNLWITNGKSLYVLNDNKLARMNLELDESNISSIYHFRDNTLIINSISGHLHSISETVYDEKSNTINFKTHTKYPYTVKKIGVTPDETLIYSYINDRLLKIYRDNHYTCSVIGLRTGRINNVVITKDSNLVVNADRNYVVIKNEDFKLATPLQDYNGEILTSHLIINSNYDVFNFMGNELILTNNQEVYDITENFRSIIDYRIMGMDFIDDILFFHTSKTIYFIDDPLKIATGEILELKRLNIEFNNINDIICHNNALYIASDDGLISIPIKDCVNAEILIPEPYFYSVAIDENRFDLSSGEAKFESTERLSIDFASLNYSSTPSNYSYMLEGIDQDWITGNNLQVTYLNLPPGNYTFKLRARKGTEEFSPPIELPVLVQPTFFQRVSTKIVIILFLLSGIFLIIRSFYKRKMKQKETDSMIITLEHKALQSMMNPHFIFNALGSIQRYLLLSKAEEAGIYLSQFARLIRQNMNSLKSNSIRIEDEVERLRNYIELEQFRMNNKFDYAIEIDEKIDGDEIAIPSMIIQPFVENAIWHGVSSIPEKGKIWIKINSINEKSLEIVIEDNGIGIKKSKPHSKSEQNLNMGVSITEKRLQLIGEKYDILSKIITEELSPGLDNPGTRIKMVVPVIY